jgi:hypothetical protein
MTLGLSGSHELETKMGNQVAGNEQERRVDAGLVSEASRGRYVWNK